MQQALADAVLHINRQEWVNQEWKLHIGPQMQATVGNFPRRRSKRMLATFLSRMKAGTPGKGLLRAFIPSGEADRPSHAPVDGPAKDVGVWDLAGSRQTREGRPDRHPC